MLTRHAAVVELPNQILAEITIDRTDELRFTLGIRPKKIPEETS